MKTPSAPAILTEASLDRNALFLLVSALTLGTTDNGLKIALCDVRKVIQDRRAWELRTSGLTLHEAKTRRHTCTFATCSCGDQVWCVGKALLYVLRCHQANQELAQEVIEATEAEREARQQDQERDEALLHVQAWRTIDRVAA